jgi:two-component system, OmpR family, sensor kinase
VITTAARGLGPQAADREVAIAVLTDEELAVVADPDRVRQVLDNLIRNAVQHSPAGSTVEVTCRLMASDERPRLAIEVRDHGPGFPPGFLPHAFERFRRADHARGRADGGTGLGLAIVASIARAHGGTAAAANHPEGGAVVRIELPADGPTGGPAGR